MSPVGVQRCWRTPPAVCSSVPSWPQGHCRRERKGGLQKPLALQTTEGRRVSDAGWPCHSTVTLMSSTEKALFAKIDTDFFNTSVDHFSSSQSVWTKFFFFSRTQWRQKNPKLFLNHFFYMGNSCSVHSNVDYLSRVTPKFVESSRILANTAPVQ